MTYPLRLPKAGETWRIRLRTNTEIPPCPHCGGRPTFDGTGMPDKDGMEVTVHPLKTLLCSHCYGSLSPEGWYDVGIPSGIPEVNWAVPYTFLEPVNRDAS